MSAAALVALLALIPAQYRTADLTHDAASAARLRTLSAAVAQSAGPRSGAPGGAGRAAAAAAAARLSRTLGGTRVRLKPWPLPQTVAAQAAAVARAAGVGGRRPPARPYDAISSSLARDPAGAYALFAAGPGKRLAASNGALAAQAQDGLWRVVADAQAPPGSPAARRIASDRRSARAAVQTAATALGDETVGRATVVADAGVIVFREGLEAVLILAAITASFVGARRHLRRPVLIGGLLGLVASAVTYVLAQTLIAALGDGGLRLQAVTGLLAIAVLLVVTNWFFHRVYWSEWIGRFNRRRKMLEQVDRLGFISGQTAGFLLLGLTSVYREGFETVLFLQNLQVSAGTGATVLGVGFGLAATAAVGALTFVFQRKLPYRRMLIATGVLIGIVLAVMVGTTIHTLQGLGWLSTSAAPFTLTLGWGRWLGLYANWEGIGAQLFALAVVYGSYALARLVQSSKRRRAIARTEGLPAA